MKKFISIIIILMVCLTSRLGIVNCQDPEGLEEPIKISDYTGNLNTDFATNKLPPGDSPDKKNVVTDETSALTMREGIANAFNLPVSSDTKIYNGFNAVYDDGSSEFIVHAGSGIYSTSGDDVWTCIASSVSSKYIMQFAMFKGEVWCTNGVNDVGIWNKETYTTYSFIPKGRYILVDKEQVLMAGMFEDPSAVRFSNLLIADATYSTAKDEEDWPGANQLPCGVGDGQIITGLFKMENKVYVTKIKSIYGLLTDEDYIFAKVYLYTDLYGSVSQRSISGYRGYKILLDKTGLGAYNGGADIEIISKDLDEIIKKIGIINTNYGRGTITTNADFSTGTFVNCYNNTGTIEISSSVKFWDITADFEGSGYSVSQTTGMNGEVKLEQITTVNYGLTPINVMGINSNLTVQSGSLYSATDSNFSSYVTLKVVAANSWATAQIYGSFGLTNKLKKIKIKILPLTPPPSGIRIGMSVYNVNGTKYTLFEWDNTFVLNTFYTYYPAYGIYLFNEIPFEGEYLIPENYYNDVIFGDVSFIELFFWYSGVTNPNIRVFEIEAYTLATKQEFYQTGTYTSPIFDSGQTTTLYQFLYPSENLGIGESTGTINYSVRSDDASDMSSPTAWYSLGVSSAINTALDNNRYFQWKADLWASTITATPTIYNVTLQYGISVATYSSKVNNIGDKITNLGSFLASNKGTVIYRVRASSNTYDKDVATLPETGANQWTAITNGDNLSTVITSTNNRYIQTQSMLNSKDAEIESLTFTWFEGGAGSGGDQDVSSINSGGRYYIAYSTWADYNTDVLVFDRNGKFGQFDWDVTGFVEFNNKLYILSSTAPVILEALTGTDDSGVPIDMYYRGPDYDLGYTDRVKEYRYIYITGKKQDDSFVWVDVFIDYSTAPVKSIYCDLSSDSNFRLQMSDQCYGKNIATAYRSTAPVCEIQYETYRYKLKPLR